MNQNPLWKYLLIAVVLTVAAIFALPNLYPADPSLQISGDRGVPVDDALLQRVNATLEQQGVVAKSVEIADNRVEVRLNNLDDQQAIFKPMQSAVRDGSYITAQNLLPTTPKWLKSFNAKPMYLGLDLRGGVHFLMQLDMASVISGEIKNYNSDIKSTLSKAKAKYGKVTTVDDSLQIAFKSAADLDKAKDVIQRQISGELDLVEVDDVTMRANISDAKLLEIKRSAVKRNITALRKRVNELGVAEPVIQQQGMDRIVVQLPGIQDPVQAKKILGSTATLAFRLLDTEADPYSSYVPASSQKYRERNGNPVVLKRRPSISGDKITNAASGFDNQGGTPNVSITMNAVGAKQMARMTQDNIKKPMATVFIEYIDGKKKEEVISVATIQAVLSKNFQITGLDSPAEAYDLALLLRAGALAAPMTFVEERTVGPSLGADNIKQGFRSVMIGFLLVVIFMAFYYRVFGLIADVALFLNLALIVAVLSMLQATLTLPGIAGIVLTVGMAVDANVLIFERIREELRAGQSPQAAIDGGYAKAFSTIADANVTTLIAALVLFVFGTGPIKGFAVTLSIGIMASMFTAIVVTRVLVNLIYGRSRGKALAV